MAEDKEVIQRLTNLTFALLGAERPREYDWVRSRVEGYRDREGATFHRQLSRDINTIRRAGVPARMENGLVWIDKDAYVLEPIEFTNEEATILGLAGDLGREGSLGAFARSGWTKLAASGATRSFDSPALASLDNDIMRLDAETLKNVTACIRSKTRMIFDYRPAPTVQAQRRTMDPWGIVALNNRAYVVGYDIDRNDERAFRAKRVANVRKAVAASFHGPTRPLGEVVEDSLRGPVTDARITVAEGIGEDLASKGTRSGEVIELQSVERDWLVRTVASLAPHVSGIEPEDVKHDVIALLNHALGESQGENNEG